METSDATPKEKFIALYSNFGKSQGLTPSSARANYLEAALPNLISEFTQPNAVSSGHFTSNMEQVNGSIFVGKIKFTDDRAGYWLGIDTDNIAKFTIGNTTNFLKWDGNTLIIKGVVSATAINIPDTTTQQSFHVDGTGNTWWGSTTQANSLAQVDNKGNATFAGLTILNMRVSTDFENGSRFLQSTGGSGSNSFGNQGVTIAPGSTSNSFSRMLWWITNFVYNNNPTFHCSLVALNLNSNEGAAFIGLGSLPVSGSGYLFGNTAHCGFYFRQQTPNVFTVATEQGNGLGVAAGSVFTTIQTGQNIEVFMKMISGVSVSYYYRIQGGPLQFIQTLATALPSGGENYIQFSTTNMGLPTNFQLQLQSASYEH